MLLASFELPQKRPKSAIFQRQKGTFDSNYLRQNRELSEKTTSLEAHFEVVSFGRTLHPFAMFVPSVRNERPLHPQRTASPSATSGCKVAIQRPQRYFCDAKPPKWPFPSFQCPFSLHSLPEHQSPIPLFSVSFHDNYCWPLPIFPFSGAFSFFRHSQLH